MGNCSHPVVYAGKCIRCGEMVKKAAAVPPEKPQEAQKAETPKKTTARKRKA